ADREREGAKRAVGTRVTPISSTDHAIRVTYDFRCEADPAIVARAFALEQTVELPDGIASPAIEEQIVGRVEAIEPLAAEKWRAVIAYPEAVTGDDVPQLLNVLFGNISMRSAVRISAVEWPHSVLSRMPGPRFGIEGLRALCGMPRRPLLCAALK